MQNVGFLMTRLKCPRDITCPTIGRTWFYSQDKMFSEFQTGEGIIFIFRLKDFGKNQQQNMAELPQTSNRATTHTTSCLTLCFLSFRDIFRKLWLCFCQLEFTVINIDNQKRSVCNRTVKRNSYCDIAIIIMALLQ